MEAYNQGEKIWVILEFSFVIALTIPYTVGGLCHSFFYIILRSSAFNSVLKRKTQYSSICLRWSHSGLPTTFPPNTWDRQLLPPMLPLLPVITRHIIIVVVAIIKRATSWCLRCGGRLLWSWWSTQQVQQVIRRHIWYDSRDVTMERLVTNSHDMCFHHSPAMIPERRRRWLYPFPITLHHRHYSNLV